MSQKYLVEWTENVHYSVEVEANSEQEAIAMLESPTLDPSQYQETGCEVETDSIEATPIQ